MDESEETAREVRDPNSRRISWLRSTRSTIAVLVSNDLVAQAANDVRALFAVIDSE